ncbi:probable peptidoglycan muropeptide transporter SLC46 [Procambarus clarkii]|uniref:probable peptidoglycan muropeptide transporter SLC46 n=1 Tax=Procambarus clarkii TaxID=6728 RepID=UPI0037449EB0
MSGPQEDTGASSVMTGEKTCAPEAAWKPAARVVWGWVNAVRLATLEPVMLLDGACNQAMLIFSENIQLNKICSVKLGLPEEVCGNMTAYEEETIVAQQAFTKFSVYNAILMSLVPAFMGIFLGAWSDKYGRKVPLLITLTAHACYAGGYLLYNYMSWWPVEVLFLVTFLEALGGGNACFLAMGTCYTSDLSSLKTHTSRVSTNNSLWYLGGPLGTLLCGFFIATGNDNGGLLLLLIAYLAAILYVAFFIAETHGPFMDESFRARSGPDADQGLKKEDITVWQMAKDFFRPKHLVDVYKTALKRREGNTRVVIVAVIVANMIRRVARGFFMYMFVRRVLLWEGDDYSFWMSYRTLVAALGSLSLVPTLSNLLNFSDLALVVLGTVSIMLEYLCYGLVTSGRGYLLWVGPPLGLLANANIIALRSSATKLVSKQEKGGYKTLVNY